MAEQRFDFLRELVKNIPDISLADEAAANFNDLDDVQSSPEQDSFSDAVCDNNTVQQPTTSANFMHRNANETLNGLDLSMNGVDDNSKFRRTRSMNAQYEQQRVREIEVIERLQQSVAVSKSAGKNSSGVIMHTNAIVPKLLRTESLPATETCNPNKRARQSPIATSAPKIPALPSTPAAAIPAPILNFDFSSKPVVKIDYSNIAALTNTADIEQPLTSSSSRKNNNNSSSNVTGQIDFSNLTGPAPISINIDLSSIKLNNGACSSNCSAVSSSSTPSTSTSHSKITKDAVKSALKPNTIANMVITTKDTLFELDEDYDNI